MKAKIILCLAGLTLAGSAIAQPVPGGGYPDRGDHRGDYQGGGHQGGGYDAGTFWRGAPDSPRERIQFLQNRIDRGISDGSLDRREARRASGELAKIRQMDRRLHYRDGGRLDPRDRDMIQSRLDDLSRRLHWMRQNW